MTDVEDLANEFRVRADRIAGGLPAGRSRLAEQLRDAAIAIASRIADGGTVALHEQAKLYRMARHSATEAAALLDACRIVASADEPAVEAARCLVPRIFARLTDLIRDATMASPPRSLSSWLRAMMP